MTFNIGFSGTRFGMTPSQEVSVFDALRFLVQFQHFMGNEVAVHHGDCVGADAQFHHMARGLGVDAVIIHPPVMDAHRAFCEGDISRAPYPHLVRNTHIVQDANVMITAPYTEMEAVRGGTWSTTRLAREQRKLWRLVLPSGISVPGPGAKDK